MSTNSLRDEVTNFHNDLTALNPRIDDLAIRIKDASTKRIEETGAANSQALLYVQNLLEFVQTTTVDRKEDGEPSPRVIAELHSLVAHLYGRFCVAKGVASDVSRSCSGLSEDIKDFCDEEFQPLMARGKDLNERVNASTDETGSRAQEVKTEQLAAQADASAKNEAIISTERQLKELQTNLQELQKQIEVLGEEKKVLERKATNAKERQRQQGATAAAGFFSMFAPVFSPLAMSGGKFAQVAHDQIRQVDEKITNLKQQCDGSNPVILEFSLSELRTDHDSLEKKTQEISSVLFELENEKQFAENTKYLLSTAWEQLEAHTSRVKTIEQGVRDAKHALEVEAAHAEAAAGGTVFLMHGMFTQELGYNGMANEVLESIKTLLDIVQGPERYKDMIDCCWKVFNDIRAKYEEEEDKDVVDLGKEMAEVEL